MFNLAWGEILLVAAVAVFVIGPQEIPKVMYNLGRIVRRLNYVRFAVSQQFDDFMKEHDLEDLRRGVNFEAPETDEAEADEDFMTQGADDEAKP